MTEKGKKRAVNALMMARTYSDRYFPQCWVVNDSVFFTRNAARRAEECENERAVVVTIEEAHMLIHGNTNDLNIIGVDREISQEGDLFANGKLYGPDPILYIIKH